MGPDLVVNVRRRGRGHDVGGRSGLGVLVLARKLEGGLFVDCVHLVHKCAWLAGRRPVCQCAENAFDFSELE